MGAEAGFAEIEPLTAPRKWGAVLKGSGCHPNDSLSVHLPDTILDVPNAAHTADTGPRPGPALWRIRPDSRARAHPDLAGGAPALTLTLQEAMERARANSQ